jgi:transmembrane protein EpsG
MIVYLSLDILILALGLFFAKNRLRVGKREVNSRSWFFILSSILLIFISSFRGDFSSDYSGYVDMYNRYMRYPLDSILSRGLFTYPEKGYLLFQYFVKEIFGDPIYLFILSSILIVAANMLHLFKYTTDDVLAVMLFLEAGVYYSSFNLMRQVMAAAIVVLGSKYLYERRLIPYLIIIIVASLVHTTALVMIPFYFFCTIRVGKKNIIFYALMFAAIALLLPYGVSFVQGYYWDWYNTSTAVGYSWKNIVLPASIAGFAIVNYLVNRSDYEDDINSKTRIVTEKHNILGNSKKTVSVDLNVIWLNATFLYLTFYLLGLQLRMAQRFASFFSLYAICFYANQVTKSKYRNIIVLATIILLIAFGYITKTDFPYYFIWSK